MSVAIAVGRTVDRLGFYRRRNLPFLDPKTALARLLRNTEAGILFNEHIVEDGPIAFAHACRLGAESIVSKKIDGPYRSGPCRVWIKVRNPAPASPCSGRGARFGIDEPEAARARSWAMTRRKGESPVPTFGETGRITWRYRPKRCGAP